MSKGIIELDELTVSLPDGPLPAIVEHLDEVVYISILFIIIKLLNFS